MEGTDSMKQAGQVIAALEQRISGARRMPMTSLSMVDAGALIDLIGQLRIALPKAVLEAQEILASREKILADARADADSIYNQACVHADKMLSGAAAALSRSANDLAALRDNLLGQHTNA